MSPTQGERYKPHINFDLLANAQRQTQFDQLSCQDRSQLRNAWGQVRGAQIFNQALNGFEQFGLTEWTRNDLAASYVIPMFTSEVGNPYAPCTFEHWIETPHIGELHDHHARGALMPVYNFTTLGGTGATDINDNGDGANPHRVGAVHQPNRNWFRDRCNQAGLPLGTSAHGLRKAACRRLAEAGCSANLIAAVSGHKSLREVQRYTEAADQARMARSAIETMASTFSAPVTKTSSVKPR